MTPPLSIDSIAELGKNGGTVKEVFEMVIRFIALVAFVFSIGAAQAATISGTGSLSSSGAGDFAFFGTGVQDGAGPNLSISTSSAGNFFASGPLTPPPAVILTGSSLVSTTFGQGFIEILYGSSGGTLATDFAQFLVRIDNFGIPFANADVSSTAILVPTTANISVTSAYPAVIPLPAGLPLLLGGVGALALLRRRSVAQTR